MAAPYKIWPHLMPVEDQDDLDEVELRHGLIDLSGVQLRDLIQGVFYVAQVTERSDVREIAEPYLPAFLDHSRHLGLFCELTKAEIDDVISSGRGVEICLDYVRATRVKFNAYKHWIDGCWVTGIRWDGQPRSALVWLLNRFGISEEAVQAAEEAQRNFNVKRNFRARVSALNLLHVMSDGLWLSDVDDRLAPGRPLSSGFLYATEHSWIECCNSGVPTQWRISASGGHEIRRALARCT